MTTPPAPDAAPIVIVPACNRMLGQQQYHVAAEPCTDAAWRAGCRLHGEGVDRLAPGLRVEARAPDGLVKASSVDRSPQLAFAVHRHPEHMVEHHPVSMRRLGAFGDAARVFGAARLPIPAS